MTGGNDKTVSLFMVSANHAEGFVLASYSQYGIQRSYSL